MEFPFAIRTVCHKHGGTITRVLGIDHRINKPSEGRSRDCWFFKADVLWNDGSKSEDAEVPPWALCCDNPSENVELNALFAEMNEYLNEHGEWCSGTKHDGWYARRGTGRDKRAQAGLAVARSVVRGVLTTTR